MNLIKPSFSIGYAKNASESANPNLWKGLVGAWMPSFGVTGDTLKDVSGNGNDGTLTNMDAASDWVGTSKGLALDFDFDDRVIVWHNSKVDVKKQLTVTVLCKPSVNRNSWTALAYKNVPQTNGSYHIGIDPFNNLAGGVKDGNWRTVQTSASVAAGSWHYVAMTIDENLQEITFYKNGKIVYQSAWTWVMNGNNYPLTIASNGGSEYFYGQIGFVSLHNRALSPTEIKQLYLNPSAPFQKKTTTVVSVPVAPPTTTAKAVVLKKPKPSYATGYARNASESANPNLWKGLVGAWMPSFGVTGGEVKELTSKSPNLTLQNIPYSNWEVKDKSLAVMLEGNDDYMNGSYCDAVNFGYKSFAVTSHFYVTHYNALEAMFDGRTSSSPYHGFHTYMRYSSSVWVQLRSSGALDQYAFSFPSQLAFDKIHSMSTVVDRQKATCTQYINGIYIGSSSISSGMTDINSNTDFRFGRNIVNQYPLTGGVASLLIHHRALNEKEVRTLHANPAAPFLRKQQTVGISTAQAFNPYWANQATQLAGTLQ